MQQVRQTPYIMEPIWIGPSRNGLSIRDVSRDTRGVADRALVRLAKDGLSAETWVYAHEGHGFDGLVAFFNQMGADWRGWVGERQWSSLESDLRLTAVHDGHVRLNVVLEDSINWAVTAELTLDPGEELTSSAQGIAACFA